MAHGLLVLRDSPAAGPPAGPPGAYGRMDRDAAHDVMAGPPAPWLVTLSHALSSACRLEKS
jgi:hypothetical protein